MAYSDFTIDRVRHELGITLDFSASLFDQVSPVVASDWLVDTLALMAPIAMANTEKARSEFMVAPILGELVKRLDYGIFVFSGKAKRSGDRSDLWRGHKWDGVAVFDLRGDDRADRSVGILRFAGG